MSTVELRLVHTPVTPFTREHAVDFERYGTLIEFHLRHGADALALPMHVGESVSLPDPERRALLEFAVQQVNGRKPIIAHVSESGTRITAAAPYYWTPPPAMLVKHFAEIGAAVGIPLFVYNAPDEMQGTRLNTDLC